MLWVRLGWVVSVGAAIPLPTAGGPISTAILSDHIQFVHTDPPAAPAGRLCWTLSPRTWLLAQLESKLAFIRAGFGFGVLPFHLVESDLANGKLAQIAAEDAPLGVQGVSMAAVYRTDSP